MTDEDLTSGKRLGDLTEYCLFGDPTAASAAKGRQFIKIMLDELLKIIDNLNLSL